jgi:hypothetical protein
VNTFASINYVSDVCKYMLLPQRPHPHLRIGEEYNKKERRISGTMEVVRMLKMRALLRAGDRRNRLHYMLEEEHQMQQCVMMPPFDGDAAA